VRSERPATALTEGHIESKKEIELRQRTIIRYWNPSRQWAGETFTR